MWSSRILVTRFFAILITPALRSQAHLHILHIRHSWFTSGRRIRSGTSTLLNCEAGTVNLERAALWTNTRFQAHNSSAIGGASKRKLV